MAQFANMPSKQKNPAICRAFPSSGGGFCTHIPDHLHRLRGHAYQITEVRKLP